MNVKHIYIYILFLLSEHKDPYCIGGTYMIEKEKSTAGKVTLFPFVMKLYDLWSHAVLMRKLYLENDSAQRSRIHLL